MSSPLGKDCCICSCLLNGLIYEYTGGYVGYACCISNSRNLTSEFRNYWRIDTFKSTEIKLSDEQLIAALQSTTAVMPVINNYEEKEIYLDFTLYKHKYKRL